MRLLLVGLLLLLMLGLQQVQGGAAVDVGARAALAFGFLLLSGFMLGELLARFMPRITGYLIAGMVFGPHLIGLVDAKVVAHLRLVNDLALVLIAMTAGAELELGRLRQRARGILSISLVQTVVVFGATTAALWLLRGWLSLFDGLGAGHGLALAAVLGVIATATSPSTAVAVIVESRSKGPVTDTVLGATVLKDILVLAGFSLVMAIALPRFVADAEAGTGIGHLLLEVGLSLAAGVVFGGLQIAYLRFVGRQTVLFVVGAAFLLISLSEAFGLDVLLVAVAAGFTVRNFSQQGGMLAPGLERASGPVFLIFFCLAGAGLDLGVLAGLWRAALVVLALRALFTWLGCDLGARLAREPQTVRRHAWTGFLGQAGVSLGLATVLRQNLGEVGAAAADLIVGTIVVNQVVGPVIFRWSLLRTREAAATRQADKPSGADGASDGA